MAHEKVNVICDNLCLEEGMTKVQIMNELDNKASKEMIQGIASGSPKGHYIDSAALKAANPETGVYVATGNGHIYSWTKDSTEEPIDLGVYQATIQDYDITLNIDEAVPNSKTVGDYIKNITTNILNTDDELIPLITSIQDNKYYDRETGLGDAAGYQAITLDVSKLVGYELEVVAYQQNRARTIVMLQDGSFNLINAMQSGKGSFVIPENATIMGISNKKNLGDYSIRIKTKPNTKEIFDYAKKENINRNYLKWESLKNSTNKTTFSNRIHGYLTDPVTTNGYLTLKINSLRNAPLKLIKMSSDGLIKDVFVTNVKAGDNEIETPLYFETGDLIGFQTYYINMLQYTNVTVNWKNISTSNDIKADIYKGNTLDLTTGTSYSVGLIMDYKLSTFSKVEFNDITHKETTDLSSIMRNNPNLKIKLIGDSITAGYGIGANNSWAGNFINYFSNIYPNMTITNVASSGRDSTWVVNNISTLISDDDDVVMLMIGTNNRYTQIKFDSLYSDLTTIKDYCEARDIKLINIIPPISTPGGTEGEDKGNRLHHMDEIVHVIKAWCIDNNKDFIDTYNKLYEMSLISGNDISTYFIDGLHPTADTSYLLFRIICNGINMDAKIQNATW